MIPPEGAAGGAACGRGSYGLNEPRLGQAKPCEESRWGERAVGSFRVRDRGWFTRVVVAHNWPAVVSTARDHTCKEVALGHHAYGCLDRGRVGKEVEEAREGHRRSLLELVAGSDTCNMVTVGGCD